MLSSSHTSHEPRSTRGHARTDVGASENGSELHDRHRLAHGVRALAECHALRAREFDFDDLLQTIAAELAGHPEEQPLHSILALEPRGTWENAPLVEHDCLAHLHGGGGRRIVRRAGLEVL